MDDLSTLETMIVAVDKIEISWTWWCR